MRAENSGPVEKRILRPTLCAVQILTQAVGLSLRIGVSPSEAGLVLGSGQRMGAPSYSPCHCELLALGLVYLNAH